MGKGKDFSSSSSSEDESSSSSSSSLSSVSDGARRRDRKKVKRAHSAKPHKKNDSKSKKAKSKRRSDRAPSRGSQGSLPAGSLDKSVRGRLVLPADQVVGQSIPLGNGKEGTCSGVLYFTKNRKWMYKTLASLVFLPDHKISKAHLSPLTDALPERKYVKAENEDEKGSFALVERTAQQKLQASINFATAFEIEAKAVSQNVGVLYTNDVVNGTNRDLASAWYHMAVHLGLTATSDDSEITKSSIFEFLTNRGIDLNAKANPTAVSLGKRSAESALVVDLTEGGQSKATGEACPKPKEMVHEDGRDDALRFQKKSKVTFTTADKEQTPPPETKRPESSGGVMQSTPERAQSLKRQLDAMGVVLVDKDTALAKGLWSEPERAKSLAEQRSEKISQLVQSNRLPDNVTHATTKADIDGLVFAALRKNWASVKNLLKLLDPVWVKQHPQGSVKASDYKYVIGTTYRDYVWAELFPGDTPPESFWVSGAGMTLLAAATPTKPAATDTSVSTPVSALESRRTKTPVKKDD